MITSGNLIQERYRVIRPLGSGGFGAVYLAEDQRLARPVAIKEMSEARLGDEERRVAVDLFEREALMLAQLDHPGLTRVWDYFQEGGHAFLVMEYVPGLTLRDLLRRLGGPLPEGFVVECALQLCAVLAYLHSRRPPVIFRDLKPANVMVVLPPDVEPADLVNFPPDALVFKLIDFGIARIFKPDQVGDTLVIGTPGYAPPEQYGQGQTDVRSDVYSLGATIYHLLSGQTPNRLLLEPLADVAPAVSPELARVVARATMLDPAARYPDIAALRHDLLAITRNRSGGIHAVARPPASEQRAPTPSQHPRMTVPLAPTLAPARPRPPTGLPLLMLIAGVLVIVALGTVAFGAFNRSAPQPRRPTSAATAATRPTALPQVEWTLPGAPGRIAFGQTSDGTNYSLFVVTLDGKPPRSIATDGSTIAPAWSPDGQRLAITRAVSGGRAIFVGSLDNPASEQFSPSDMFARYAAWSPDGGRLAFGVAPSLSGPFRLEIIDLAGGQPVFPSGADGVAWIAWSRGGLLYAASAGAGSPQDIFTLDENGTPRNLTNTPDAEEDFPDRSPDGKRIVFVSSPPGRENLPQRQIFVINADGSGRIQLTYEGGPHTNPVWSPDGKWIAYLSQAAGEDWQVWAMRADGSDARQLTFSPQRKFYLAWGK